MTTKIIMDCDPGIDDAAAISVALNNPALAVKLITTVAGNVTVDKTTKNALKLVHFFNKKVPVASGAEQPLIKPFEDAARIHGESGMPGYNFDELVGDTVKHTAMEALYQTIMKSPEPITLVPTGAYTNIALLLATHPEVKPKISRIIAMGGSLGRGNMTSAAEFNVYTDPDAAQIMYNSGIPIVMIGLDVTMKALLTQKTLNTVGTLGEAGNMLASIFKHYYEGHEGGIPMHDVNTICYLLHPEFYQTARYWIDIQTSGPAIGETVADIRGAYHLGNTNAQVAVGIDADDFNQWFIEEVQNMKTE
ncbi:Inosine-uridine preferring nucleoside hydrolase [Pediococcus damnosus]|uniref:Inosine-uridine preferring nucleoside hydrolase n=1 Tax=Pediococcus damnosus TaxID=51663 RepID=A0A0R2HH09_9LACO|nr:ribonucleoside hydrolase RihC [Pediococcus damnosus]AMV60661.1 Inosine-uridine preferring nucleoside hydrolase [Pediococcus damnosus]AMV63254.1 Inosine-uridine preferring nucleoside hydrolase [Pediococcus damnosus]AMV64976.1 Inosine-uridine preferring nucleoside hydrolase [Pediococcus damnosus]AMV66850.1 Inosine-uridine preferring nucleoside hydrolase [Pediococcus damnosus]AMV69782.1 Inosine-uridine preferring nucleoside hydrolase [Pediococcus damnosus]